MTPKTLRKERKEKFIEVLKEHSVFAEIRHGKIEREEAVRRLAELLADAAESRSERQTDEEQPAYHTAYRRGEQEAPDKLDALLDMANFPGAKQQARTDALLSAYGEAFTVNSETSDWKKLAKYAISEQAAKGWDPARFIAWVKQQKGYPEFWTARRMLTEYPKAFVNAGVDVEERPEYKPFKEQEGNYVPRPEHLKPNLRKSTE